VKIATVVSRLLRTPTVASSVLLTATGVAQSRPVTTASLAADIPSQPLAAAFTELANQTGLQLVYLSEVVRNQRSHAVSAGLDTHHALTRMLKGTGLHYRYLTPQSVRILAPASRVSDGTSAEEVIVTATRRQEASQNVPITAQVLTAEALARLNIRTFDDLVTNTPGVTALGVGPSQNNIYIRGLATGEAGNQASGSNSSFPNVAIYLDEQSVQLPGRNLDVYAADLQRIEVLQGPQGTLFGAGAEAGVLRYITNKPRLNSVEIDVNAGPSFTEHGAAGYGVDLTVNVPLLADRLAARAVVYDERRGGYIDNIPATFARSNSDMSIRYANGQVPANSVAINNASLAAKDINPVTYKGGRLQLLYRMTDDWSALLSQSYQDIAADGVFTEMAQNSIGTPQPPLTTQLFNPAFNKDRFENTAITLEGRIGELRALYAGAYLVRNIQQLSDYTNYARTGTYVDYYQCVTKDQGAATTQCFTPSTTWTDRERNTHQSHELRLSTPNTWRLRGVGGLFLEKYRIADQGDWYYLTALPYFQPIGPPTGYYTSAGHRVCGCDLPPDALFVSQPVTSNNPNPRPLGDGFFNDITRGYAQKAAYASVDFDIVSQLTLSLGTRYSRIETNEVGSDVGSFGCGLLFDANAPNPCLNREGSDLNAQHLDRAESGFKSRVSLSWRLSEAALLYYTWSQGSRPGGFNRGFAPQYNSPLVDPGEPVPPGQLQAHQHGSWQASMFFIPDTLTNFELGWKTSWQDAHVQWNGTVYQENWNHAQVGADDIPIIGNSVLNGGNYQIRGVESSAKAQLPAGFTLDAAVGWNRSKLVKEAQFVWRDGTPIDFSSLTDPNTGKPLVNPTGTLGSSLAGSPRFQGNLHLRYEVTLDGFNAFAQVGAMYQSSMRALTDPLTLDFPGNSVAYDLPGFTTYDAALGMGRDSWSVQLYGQNLSDVRAELYANANLGYKAVTVNRPRTLGLRFSYKYRKS
jgi:iron complex outermembrane receptor protein